jgi:hypothetical protein
MGRLDAGLLPPWVLAVVVVSFGLITSTPVNCLCAPTDHLGLAIHSLVPHTHASDVYQTRHERGPALPEALSPDHTSVVDGVPSGEALMLAAASIVHLAGSVAALLQTSGRQPLQVVRRPSEWLRAPPTAPPRHTPVPA